MSELCADAVFTVTSLLAILRPVVSIYFADPVKLRRLREKVSRFVRSSVLFSYLKGVLNFNAFVLFGIVKYLLTGKSGDRKFTIYGFATG